MTTLTLHNKDKKKSNAVDEKREIWEDREAEGVSVLFASISFPLVANY